MTHETLPLIVHGESVEIDRGMVATILWLNEMEGVKTLYCCQGGPKPPYVALYCSCELSLKRILDSIKYTDRISRMVANWGRCEVEHDLYGKIRYNIRFVSRERFKRWKQKEGLM